MRRIFGVLMMMITTVGVANATVYDPTTENGIEINPVVDGENLTIEISENLVAEDVTVSVFSSIGKIVLQETLDTGMNELSISDLQPGEYTVVVRQNDEFKSKQSFVVK